MTQRPSASTCLRRWVGFRLKAIIYSSEKCNFKLRKSKLWLVGKSATEIYNSCVRR